jgi:coproporphyrinogen III oxidase
MSLPSLAGWKYDFRPNPGSAEFMTKELLKKGISWA